MYPAGCWRWQRRCWASSLPRPLEHPRASLIELPLPRRAVHPVPNGQGVPSVYQSVKVSVAPRGAGHRGSGAGLVPLAPQRAAELVKDRVAWHRECRRCDTLGAFRTPDGTGEGRAGD